MIVSSFYRTVPKAKWEIFSTFLVVWSLFHEPLGENNMRNEETRKIFCQYCTRQHEITTLSLNGCQ